MGVQGPNYRVMTRRQALLALALLLLFSLACLLLVQQLAEAWIADFQARLAEDRRAAAEAVLAQLRWFFLFSPLLLTIAALLVIGQGVRAVQSGFSPPAGAWIVAGQRTHSGRAARVRGHLQWILGVLLVALAWFGSWQAYRVVEALLQPLLDS